MSDENIHYLLDHAKNAKQLKATHQTGDKHIVDDHVRNSTVSWVHTKAGYEMLKPFITTANEMCGWHYDISKIEGVQIASYKAGEYYGWHIDGDSDHWAARKLINSNSPHVPKLNETKDPIFKGLVRKLSIIVQLSDPEDYEGGDIYFSRPPKDGRLDAEGETIPQFREKGSVIVFPSYVRHKVSPVTKGIRKSATAWICGPPFK